MEQVKKAFCTKKWLLLILAFYFLFFSTTLPVNAAAQLENGNESHSGGDFWGTTNEGMTIEPFAEDPDDGIPACQGTFYNEVSNIPVQVANAGGDNRSLAWGFNLTPTARTLLGSTVIVSMISATVNGNSINPPYVPHTNTSTYNFHGSLKNYNYIGQSGGGTLKKNDTVYFYWTITSVKDPKVGAYRYIRCRVN
ncbi:hypothetical protein [Paenibacillus medicaginis]|uniref:Uncharacterized protein n=1 Tax=Paenibacillus medicaginis TaxID=1470560 RepID=A0ABV5C5G4_9BACL